MNCNLTWFGVSVGIISLRFSLGMCEGFVTLTYPFCTRLVCSMKEACTREVEDLVFGILALTRQVCMSYLHSSVYLKHCLCMLAHFWSVSLVPQNLDLELFF